MRYTTDEIVERVGRFGPILRNVGELLANEEDGEAGADLVDFIAGIASRANRALAEIENDIDSDSENQAVYVEICKPELLADRLGLLTLAAYAASKDPGGESSADLAELLHRPFDYCANEARRIGAWIESWAARHTPDCQKAA